MFRRAAIRHFSPLSHPQFPSLQARRSLFARRPHAASNGNLAPVKNYKVKFVQPPFLSWQRQRKFLIYATGFYIFLAYILPEFVTISFEEIEEEEVEGEDGEDAAGEEGSDDDVEDGLFIPCGWPKKQQRTYYKANDPEWKEFIKFSREPARHKEVQKRLVSGIRAEIARHPNGKMLFGDIKMDKGRYWLETVFPEGPPQEYTVVGIEFTEEFIAWSEKTVSQKEYARLYRTMVPTATIAATWASFRYHFDSQTNKVREYFGLPIKIDPEIAHLRAHLQERPNTKHFGSGSKPEQPPQTSLSKGLPPTQTAPSTSSSNNDGESGGEATDSLTPRLPSIVPRGEAKPVTLALFMHNLRKHTGRVHIEPPRGSVVLTGMVEVVGSKGRTTLDVTAAFDPKLDEYVGWSWRPRKVAQQGGQRPKGGI